MKSINENLPYPSVEEVRRYLRLWDELENYKEQENALNVLFTGHPENMEKEYVLLKVVALNHFYSTNIFNVYAVAKHIVGIRDFDARLQAGKLSIVEELRDKNKNGTGRDLYSFATKYCSHHVPSVFPIYDRYVHKVLDYFQRKYEFLGKGVTLTRYNKNVQDKEDVPLRRDYSTFKKTIESFQREFNLQQFGLKEIDQYLWQLGKDWFPNQYQTDAKKRATIKEIRRQLADKAHFYVSLKNPSCVEYEDSVEGREIGIERAVIMIYEQQVRRGDKTKTTW